MHLQCSERISILASMGYKGNSAILLPKRVSSPRSFNAPRAYSNSRPLTNMSWGGGSRKSKSTRLSTPMLFNIRTTLAMLLLWIQGMVDSYNSFQQLQRVQRRKHFPGATLPALPARWLAEALLMGTTTRLSMPLRGLQAVCLTNPQSITKRMLSIVSEVQAMLVASTHLRAPFGVGSKMRACMSDGRPEQMGRMISSFTLLPRPFTLLDSYQIASQISSWPVRKQRISPASCVRWIWSMVTTDAQIQLASGLVVQQISTGKRLPGMLMMGAPLKQSENFCASRVAEEMMIFISGRQTAKSLMRVRVISVCSDLSWAQSMIMTEQEARSGSTMNYLSSIPSVIYLMTVFSLVLSSNLMQYPTSSPNFTPISSLTLAATDIAATLLGCVHPTFPFAVQPSSWRYCGSCVVLPEPVSPTIMMTWLSRISVISYQRNLKIGRDSLTSCIGVLYALAFSALASFLERDPEPLLSLQLSSSDTSICCLALLMIQFFMNLMGLLMSISQFFLLFSQIQSIVLQPPLVRPPWLCYQAWESGRALGTSQQRPYRAFIFLSLLGFVSAQAVSGKRYSPSFLTYTVFFYAYVVIFSFNCLKRSSLIVSSELSKISFQSFRTAFTFCRVYFYRLSRYFILDCCLSSGMMRNFSSSVRLTACMFCLVTLPRVVLSFSASRRDSSSRYSASFLRTISASRTSLTQLSPMNAFLPPERSIQTKVYSAFFLTSALVFLSVAVREPNRSKREAAKN